MPALLGHEISRVASQARGEVRGCGLVNDPVLEARADREGLKAARGESAVMGYGGASAALSNASAASAAGPMQAKSGKKKIHDRGRADFESAQLNSLYKESKEDEELDEYAAGKLSPYKQFVLNADSKSKYDEWNLYKAEDHEEDLYDDEKPESMDYGDPESEIMDYDDPGSEIMDYDDPDEIPAPKSDREIEREARQLVKLMKKKHN